LITSTVIFSVDKFVQKVTSFDRKRTAFT